MSSSLPGTSRVVRRVMLSQLLFTAGNSLTTGGFFNYFVYLFSPSSLLLAALMIAPETFQSLSVLGRWLALKSHNRKRLWIVFLIVGRSAALLIPLALLWNSEHVKTNQPLYFILGCTILWYLCQGIAYVNYISWLSDLVPEESWGRLFSRRQLAGLAIAVCLPIGVVMLRNEVLKQLPEAAERISHAVIFLIGGVLTLSSILPLLCFHEVPWTRPSRGRNPHFWRQIASNRSFQCLLASRWWLAFFQGLTQAVLFKYAIDTLGISLMTYLELTSLMLLLQLPLTWWAGRLSDAFQEKRALFWSMLAVSFAIPFWIVATAETWQLIGVSFAIWSGFGVVNVCGQNLCLKLSPFSDNAGHFALYEQVAGLIAGLAGLIGGWWLDQLLVTTSFSDVGFASPYLILFTVSWIGRFTAPFWLLPIQQPVDQGRNNFPDPLPDE